MAVFAKLSNTYTDDRCQSVNSHQISINPPQSVSKRKACHVSCMRLKGGAGGANHKPTKHFNDIIRVKVDFKEQASFILAIDRNATVGYAAKLIEAEYFFRYVLNEDSKTMFHVTSVHGRGDRELNFESKVGETVDFDETLRVVGIASVITISAAHVLASVHCVPQVNIPVHAEVSPTGASGTNETVTQPKSRHPITSELSEASKGSVSCLRAELKKQVTGETSSTETIFTAGTYHKGSAAISDSEIVDSAISSSVKKGQKNLKTNLGKISLILAVSSFVDQFAATIPAGSLLSGHKSLTELASLGSEAISPALDSPAPASATFSPTTPSRAGYKSPHEKPRAESPPPITEEKMAILSAAAESKVSPPMIFIKVHLYATPGIKQTSTVQLPTNLKMQDAFEAICKKRKFDRQHYIFKMADNITAVPLQTTLEHLKATEFSLIKVYFGDDDKKASQPEASPAKPIRADSKAENAFVKIHIISNTEVTQTSTMQMPLTRRMSDVFSAVCTKRKIDPAEYTFKMSDAKSDVDMNQVLGDLKHTEFYLVDSQDYETAPGHIKSRQASMIQSPSSASSVSPYLDLKTRESAFSSGRSSDTEDMHSRARSSQDYPTNRKYKHSISASDDTTSNRTSAGDPHGKQKNKKTMLPSLQKLDFDMGSAFGLFFLSEDDASSSSLKVNEDKKAKADSISMANLKQESSTKLEISSRSDINASSHDKLDKDQKKSVIASYHAEAPREEALSASQRMHALLAKTAPPPENGGGSMSFRKALQAKSNPEGNTEQKDGKAEFGSKYFKKMTTGASKAGDL
jgi:hypothetical protein